MDNNVDFDNPLQVGYTVQLAQNGDRDAQKRLLNRLSQTRGPSTQELSGNWIDWGSMGDVLGQPFDSTRIPLSKLEQMRRDPMLAFGLATKIIPLIRAKWHIESTDPQRAAFIQQALSLVYARFILGRCNCLSFGYSPGVKRFEYMQPDWTYVDPADPDHQEKPVWPDKNVPALVWKSFVWLNPKDVRPHWNYKGEFAGIDFSPSSVDSGGAGYFGTSGAPFNFEGANAGRAADIPLDWSIWAVNEKDSEFGSIYGYPLIGHAYRYWWSYWYKFGLSDRAFEKWADPPIIMYHPAENGVDSSGNAVDFGAVALGVAEQARSGANIAIPSQVIIDIDQRTTNVREWDISQMESNANFDALIQSFNYLDVLKLRSIMVPEMGLIEGAQGQSSRNVASVFADQIQKAQAVLMEEIDYEINRFLIPQLLEVNFGPGGASCKKITTGFDPQDIETMRAVIGAIANKHGEIADVDTREMLKQVGIPLLTHEAVKNKLESIAAEQETAASLKYQALARESALKGHKPFEPAQTKLDEEPEEENKGVWQRVASLFYNEERLRLEDQEQKEAESRDRTEELIAKVTELAEKEANINLEVIVPEVQPPVIEIIEQPKHFKRIRKIFGKDDEGNITHVDEIEIEDDAH
jgi:hypothetical protein